jgi:hypothetical protein
MKKTTQRIMEKFPMLEDKFLANEDVELAADALQSLDPVQRMVKENESTYLNQSQFATFLTENGLS